MLTTVVRLPLGEEGAYRRAWHAPRLYQRVQPADTMEASERPRTATDIRTAAQHQEVCSRRKAITAIMSSVTTFHPWCRLPTELKTLILEYCLQCCIECLRLLPRYHEWFFRDYFLGFRNKEIRTLSIFIGTRNRELTELALDVCKSRVFQCQDPANVWNVDYSVVKRTYLDKPDVLADLAKRFRYTQVDFKEWSKLRVLIARRFNKPHAGTASP